MTRRVSGRGVSEVLKNWRAFACGSLVSECGEQRRGKEAHLVDAEEVEELLGEVLRVAVVLAHVADELLDEVGAGPARTASQRQS